MKSVLQGHMRLVNALSKCYGGVMGRDIHPTQEVLVTVGAYGSLFCATMGLINPGDEVSNISTLFVIYLK